MAGPLLADPGGGPLRHSTLAAESWPAIDFARTRTKRMAPKPIHHGLVPATSVDHTGHPKWTVGPRAISTVRVDQSPDVEPASGASLRKRSAHSGTLMRGGGVSPRRHDRSSRSSLLCVCEVGFRLAEGGEVLLDMLVQCLQQRLDGDL